MKDCNKCIFGMHYTSDGKLTQVCAGKNVPEKEAIAAIVAQGPCDMFEEGHKLYLEMVESGKGPCDFLCSIPADKKYIYDRRWYSKEPIGYCGSFSKGTCRDGIGDYCYNRFPCTGCMSLENHSQMADAVRGTFLSAMKAAGIPEEKLKDF